MGYIIDKLDAWLAKQKEEKVKSLYRAAFDFQNFMKSKLDIKSPPASEPGEYPHLETGEFRRSVTSEVDESKMTARVGSNKLYARFLSEGTNLMEARSMFQEALDEHWQVTARIIKGG